MLSSPHSHTPKPEFTITATVKVSIGTWFHFAIVYDSAKKQVELMQDQIVVHADGKLHHDSELKVLALPLVVGTGSFKGFVQNIRFWDWAMDVYSLIDYIDEAAVNSKGLLASWECTESIIHERLSSTSNSQSKKWRCFWSLSLHAL